MDTILSIVQTPISSFGDANEATKNYEDARKL